MGTALEQIFAKDPPRQIYHYTGVGGLLGIAKSKTIWASNIHYLNDEQDFGWALELARRATHQLRLKHSLTGDDASFLEQLRVYVEGITRVNVFVASFSEVDDLLSQWRGYCPSGKGVAVGFYSSELQRRAQSQNFRLVPVTYDWNIQWEAVQELVMAALREHRLDRSATNAICNRFADTLATIAPALKHKAFEEEREWRLVSSILPISHPQIRIREGAKRLIPYFEFELTGSNEQLVLGRLRVGPTPTVDLAMGAVGDVMWLYNIKNDGVGRSEAPYREW